MALAMLMANMVWGIGFTFFLWTDSVQRAALFQELNATHLVLPFAWGLVLTVGTTLCMIDARDGKEHPVLRRIGTGCGMAAWLYGSIVFAITGFFLVLLSVGLLNLSFWAWYYFKFVKKYTGDDWKHLIPPFH